MSFPYTTPTGLTGVPGSLSIPLTWSPSALIGGGPSLLLHFDGVNGATTTTDSSGNALPITFGGACALTTTNPKFGTASLNSSSGASTEFVNTPVVASGPVDLSTGDFTVELWVYPNSSHSYSQPFISARNNAGTGWDIISSTSLQPMNLSATFGASSFVQYPVAVSLPIGAWSSIAFVRQGNVFDLFLNGIPSGAPTTLAGSIGTSTPLFLRAAPSYVGAGFDGGIDEVRITKGTALYAPGVSYTPATAPFPGVTPAGYDVYRNGVPVAQYLGAPGFTDTVPGIGLYTYNVAAWDGVSLDTSGLSAPFTIGIGQLAGIQGKFVPAPTFKSIMVANPGLINPRIYPPLDDNTVRVKP